MAQVLYESNDRHKMVFAGCEHRHFCSEKTFGEKPNSQLFRSAVHLQAQDGILLYLLLQLFEDLRVTAISGPRFPLLGTNPSESGDHRPATVLGAPSSPHPMQRAYPVRTLLLKGACACPVPWNATNCSIRMTKNMIRFPFDPHCTHWTLPYSPSFTIHPSLRPDSLRECVPSPSPRDTGSPRVSRRALRRPTRAKRVSFSKSSQRRRVRNSWSGSNLAWSERM